MLQKTALHTLLDLDVPKDGSELLVYTPQNSPRLVYVCDFIFKQVLKVNVRITSSLADFNAYSGFRINYSSAEVQGCVQVYPSSLLFESGCTAAEPQAVEKRGRIYFFANTEVANTNPDYDIFAAVFYFISRYEEWQDFTPDAHGRFEARTSLLYKQGFHKKPMVDIWIREFADVLKAAYPACPIPAPVFRAMSTIDVDNLYAYKAKGVLRTLGACARDVLKRDFKNLNERLLVLSGKKKDPFDIYDSVSDFCFEEKLPLIYFFLFRTGTAHDRTVNPASDAFTEAFQLIHKNHALLGVHPSYEASVKKELLTQEVQLLAEKSKQKIILSRQHYLRFNIKTTPKELMEAGIVADFSMGFASEVGFRAGTSYPFYYYDFEKEQSCSLLFMPFCVMDGVYTVYHKRPANEALIEMRELVKEVKNTGGFFVSVFHERSFSDHLYPGFGTLYKKLHAGLKEA